MEKKKATVKKGPAPVQRQKYVVDAEGMAVGRLATNVSLLLRGKNTPQYQPHLDLGGSVLVKNISGLKFTGHKLDQKTYYHASGYPGGLKAKKLSELIRQRPEEVVRRAVWNMLPKNTLRDRMIKRLTFSK